jgi:probable HAF family extracellular repeat protein
MGEVVGGSDTSDNESFHATLWRNGRIHDLGTPPGRLCQPGICHQLEKPNHWAIIQLRDRNRASGSVGRFKAFSKAASPPAEIWKVAMIRRASATAKRSQERASRSIAVRVPNRSSTARNQQVDDLLDIEDVIGKRIINTRLHRNITIREENAVTALEVMSP